MNDATVTSEILKPFYVYELQEPASGKAFYVGKGTSRRAWDHLRQEIIGEDPDTDTLGEKLKAIKLIRDSGSEPRVVIIGRFDTQQEALAVECVLIKWIYGLGDLCNEVHGHRHRFVRQRANFDQVDGIDQERRARSGEYTKGFHLAAEKNGIPAQLLSLTEGLKARSPQIGITEPALGQSPNFFVSYNEDLSLKIILSAKGTGDMSVQLVGKKREKWAEIKTRIESSDLFECTAAEYAWVKPRKCAKIKFGQLDPLLEAMRTYSDSLALHGEAAEPAFDALIQ